MFIAHKREDDGTEQSVKEHLEGTAKQAAGFAKSFHAEKFGYLVGLCHDLGKYSPEFQRRIAGENIRADHSTAGAQWVNTRKPMMGKLLAFCIAGHHGGLPNGGTTADDGESNTLNGRLKKDVKDFSCYENEMNLEKHLELAKLPIKPIKGKGFSISFFVRMLYSCLVDGDY